MDSKYFNTNQRLEAVIETAIDSILTINQRGMIETVNKACLELFGYDKEELIGRNIKCLMPNPYHEEHDGYLHNYQTTRKPKIVGIGREVTAKKKNGDCFPIRLAVSEVKLTDRTIYTGIIHDLTDVMAAQEEIVRLNKDLEQKVAARTNELETVINKLLATNKTLEKEVKERAIAEAKLIEKERHLESALEKEKELNEHKSRFVSMASHEFRTPLSSILSSAAIISKYKTTEQQEKRQKHIDRIKSSVGGLTSILNDFLSLSKLESGTIDIKAKPTDIVEVIRSVIDDTQTIIKKERTIQLEMEGIPKSCSIDERYFKTILSNLFSNAVKYSEQDIYTHLLFKKDTFIYKIIDKGIGIPEHEQKHLFTRFFRAENATYIQGTGIGLDIVQRYVELMKGKVWFESNYGEGSTFFVEFPIQ